MVSIPVANIVKIVKIEWTLSSSSQIRVGKSWRHANGAKIENWSDKVCSGSGVK